MASDRTRRGVVRRFTFLTILLTLATLFAACATLFWVFELFSHFTPWLAVLALPCLLAFILLRLWRWALLSAALMLWNAYPVVQFLTDAPATAQADSKNRLGIFHFNVGLHHERPERIVSHVLRHAEQFDVVVLLEATSAMQGTLDQLMEKYPHQIRHLQDSPFGIAAISKHEMVRGALVREPGGYPFIEMALKLPGRDAPLTLYAIHPPPPISGQLAAARNAQLAYVASLAQKTSADTSGTPIVVGDFNLTPWSPYYRQFAAQSSLRPLRTPHRFGHTWPVTFDNANLGIAIDHSFAHPSLRLIERRIGPDLGSDHLPVTVTIAY